MSATAERDSVLDSQDREAGRFSSSPWSFRARAVTGEGVAGDTGNTTHHTSQAVVRVPGGDEGRQEGARPTGMEDLNFWPVEHEEDKEKEYEEEKEEEYEEKEEEEYKEKEEYEEYEEEEEYEEYEEDEYQEYEEDEYQEYEEEEEDEGEDEEAAVSEDRQNEEDWDEEDHEEVVGEDHIELLLGDREFRVAVFRILFRDLMRSLLRRLHHNNHILVRSHTGRVAVRHRPWEPENPGEGPAPSEGADLAEGILPFGPEEPEEPTEWAASQEAEEPTPEARVSEGEDITGAIMPYDEMGGCAPEEADAGSGRQHPQALVVSIEAAGSLGGRAQGLPRVVKRRINALKNLQAEYAQIEAQFYRDLYGLETKYAAFYQPLFDKRSDIINAIYEPTEDECQWEVGIQKGVCEATESEPEGKPPVNGIPRFWLTAFKNIKILRKLIQENDELILAHLKDVKIKFSGVEEPMSFTIEFVFMSTEYFFNKVLTKTYHMRSHPDDSDPFFSRGPEIISSSGCKIYWKQGKNVTMKTLNLQQCAGHGSVVPTRSKVPSRSFFTYFYPPDSPQGRLLGVAVDYKLAYIFRELLIPKPVLFFTKEAIECNSDEEGHEAGGEEGKKEDKNEEPEGGPKKNLILVEDSTGESSWKA